MRHEAWERKPEDVPAGESGGCPGTSLEWSVGELSTSGLDLLVFWRKIGIFRVQLLQSVLGEGRKRSGFGSFMTI